MKVINLFGQPGAGKSTTAAGLFHLLKLKGINCELVTEYAKDMVWRKMHPDAYADQLYILAKQNHRLERLRNQVDYVITDSPLLLSHIYCPPNYMPSFVKVVDELWDRYNNISFLLKRIKPYNTKGRLQTEDESDILSQKISALLNSKHISYFSINGDQTAPHKILGLMNLI